MTLMEFAAILAALLYGLTLAIFLAFHRLRPDVNILRDPVSNYGVGSSAALFRVYAMLGAAAALVLALEFHLLGQAPGRLVAYLALSALARAGVAIFPTDPGHEFAGRNGRLHMLFAIANFALVYMAVDVASGVIAANASPLAGGTTVLSWVAALSLAGVVLTMIGPLRGRFGLAERIFLASTALFLLLAAVFLING